MTKITFLFCLVYVFLVVDGHSILRQPQAWNTQESKSRPCGNGNMPVAAVTGANKALPGNEVSGRWDVTAGDGNGAVTITAVKNDAGAATFADGINIPITMPTIPTSGTGQYAFTFQVPSDLKCDGGADGSSCHLQFKSTSNWYSCMTLSLAVPATAAPTKPLATLSPTGSPTITPPKTCTVFATGLPFCSTLAGKSVYLEASAETMENRLQRVKDDADFNRLNPLVFRNGQTSACEAAFNEYWCARSFPHCASGTITDQCKTRCEKAMSLCDRDPLHKDAFSCNAYGTGQTNGAGDVYGTCPATTDVPQRQINLKNRYVGVSPSYWAKDIVYTDMVVYAGDKLVFKMDSATSDLYKFQNKADFDACKFTVADGATNDASRLDSGIADYSWVLDSGVVTLPMTIYFGSSKPGACSAGQKLMVEVVEFPQGSSTVPLAGNSVPEQVTPPPTSKPIVYPTPDYGVNGDDNNSSTSIAPFIVTIFCSFLLSIAN